MKRKKLIEFLKELDENLHIKGLDPANSPIELNTTGETIYLSEEEWNAVMEYLEGHDDNNR